MSDTLERVGVTSLLAAAHTAVDALLGLDPTRCSEDELLDLLRSTERLRRRLPTLEHDVLLDLEARGTHQTHGAKSMTGLLTGLLNLDGAEAAGRVHAAHACGHRRSLTGQPLEPLFALVAAAQAEGRLSERERRIITDCVTKLPEEAIEMGPKVEADLLGYATLMPPAKLRQAAERINYLYDQDGAEDQVQRRRTQRELRITQRPDGSIHIVGDGTAEFGEFLLTSLDSLAAPRPAVDGVKDPRTAGQRRHDALLEVLKLAVRSGELPTTAGVLATVILTVNAQDWVQGTGFTHTGHGAQVPTGEVKQWAGGDTRAIAVALNTMKAVTAYGTLHRFFTEGQRLVMTARDQGCSFPGCGIGPAWCQAHHIIDYADGGPTAIDDGTLLCTYHHREFQRLGWRVRMAGGHPQWTPPPWHRRT